MRSHLNFLKRSEMRTRATKMPYLATAPFPVGDVKKSFEFRHSDQQTKEYRAPAAVNLLLLLSPSPPIPIPLHDRRQTADVSEIQI